MNNNNNKSASIQSSGWSISDTNVNMAHIHGIHSLLFLAMLYLSSLYKKIHKKKKQPIEEKNER